MLIMFYIILVGFVLAILAALFVRMDARRVAAVLRYLVPAVLAGTGIIFMLVGRGGISFALFGLAAALFGRARASSRASRSSNQTSHVRTAALEMELDLDTGEINGLVLAGQFDGRELNTMDEMELLSLHAELHSDPESVQVLETYLDRRIPTWRDDFDAHTGDGLGAAPASGTMSKQEAYEILGLSAGATETEIRDAHRRLMKRMHPDTGGSVFLAARINQAKDILLRGH